MGSQNDGKTFPRGHARQTTKRGQGKSASCEGNGKMKERALGEVGREALNRKGHDVGLREPGNMYPGRVCLRKRNGAGRRVGGTRSSEVW